MLVLIQEATELSCMIPIDDFSVDMLKEIGKGTYGTIYKAKDKRGNPVAAKLITNKRHSRRGIEQNLQICARLTCHKNIIEIFHVCYHEMGTFIFSQYAQDGDLNNYFKTNFEQIKGVNAKIALMQQISDGVSFMHNNNIVHRDIKPANILVTKGKNVFEAVIKICDLGLAVHLDPSNGKSGMSTDIGTPNFKAPEFWKAASQGHTRYGKSVDIFATGLTFLAMLQFKKNANLNPMLDESLPENERGKPIGEVMFSRQALSMEPLNLVRQLCDDTNEIQRVTVLIRDMTSVDPCQRPNASQCQHFFTKLTKGM